MTWKDWLLVFCFINIFVVIATMGVSAWVSLRKYSGG